MAPYQLRIQDKGNGERKASLVKGAHVIPLGKITEVDGMYRAWARDAYGPVSLSPDYGTVRKAALALADYLDVAVEIE